MRDSSILRLLLAALIATSGWLATDFWAKRGRVRPRSDDPEPLARLVVTNNEVMKRPAQSFVWKPANKGEELYAGEAVRTTTNSDAQIAFEKRQVTVSLDPDTVIGITREGDKLNLSFIKGNLFIKAGAAADLTVQSGDRKIAIGATGSKQGGASELAVSKSHQDAPLEVQSASGAVQDLSNKGQAKAVEVSKFRVLRPRADEVSYVAPDSSGAAGRIEISFTPLDRSYEVTIEAGDTRDELKRLDDVEPVNGSSGKISVPLKVGKSFLQLIAAKNGKKEDKLKTPIARALVRAKIAPELIWPANEARVLPTGDRREVQLQWSNPGQLKNLRVEVATTPKMAPTIEARELIDQLSHNLIAGAEPRTLYWRVIGRIPITGEALISPIRSFEVLSDKPVQLTAPRLELPADQASVDLAVMRENGLKLAWTSTKGAKDYEVTVRELPDDPSSTETPPIYRFTADTASGHVEKLKTGRYSWSVAARDAFGKLSPLSEARTFTVEGIPVLSWNDKRTSETVIFKTEKPRLRAAWEPGPGKPARWRVRITPERSPAATETPWLPTTSPQVEKQLEASGPYIVEAEALDDKNNILGRTAPRKVSFEQAPPPPAPKFSEELAEDLKASERGNVEIAWLPSPDAKEYQLELRSKDGTVVKSERVKSTQLSFERLKPGEYDVVLQAVDDLGRLGPESEARSLTVPEYSDVRAPKFKTLKVK